MSKILTIDEMLCMLNNERADACALNVEQQTRLAGLFERVRQIGTEAGQLVADVLGVKVDDCAYDDPEMGGHACCIRPAHEGQEMPEALENFDCGADWEE